MIPPEYPRLYHSNSLASLDGEAGHNGLGGRISADEVLGLNVRFMFPGITLNKLSNFNGTGVGKFYFTAPDELRWQAPGDSAGDAIFIFGDGDYKLYSHNGAWIKVDIVSSQLPAVNTACSVYITAAKNTLFDDVTAAQAMSGLVDYRCFFLKNEEVKYYYAFVRPRFRILTGLLIASYPQFGNAVVKMQDGSAFPELGFIRNRRTKEIMYVSGRVNDVNTFVVQGESRGLRQTNGALGSANDVIEAIPCLDVNVAPYVPADGADIIAEGTMPPPVAFQFPDSLDDPQYNSFTLNPSTMLTVWLRRTIPAGAVQLADSPLILDFPYEAILLV